MNSHHPSITPTITEKWPLKVSNQETIKNDENSDINNDDLDKVDDNIPNENDDQKESKKS